MKRFWIGAFLASLTPVAQAAMITEVFEFTVPVDSATYSAGHVFQITATYDDAGTVTHFWGDGPNGIAEFGAGDDAPEITFDLAGTDFTLYSDAVITISGLAEYPLGGTPDDVNDFNYAQYTEYLDPYTDGAWELRYQADNLAFVLQSIGPCCDLFTVTDFFTLNGEPHVLADAFGSEPAGSMVTRRTVPEPATLTLLGLGLAGLGLARRRQGQAHTV